MIKLRPVVWLLHHAIKETQSSNKNANFLPERCYLDSRQTRIKTIRERRTE